MWPPQKSCYLRGNRQGGTHRRPCTHKAMHTQSGAHKRRSVATVRGNLHPARPDWWPPTKRPCASPGGLIATSVTYFSRQEAVRPCWRTSPPLGGTLGVPGLPGVSCIQGMHACSWYWGSEVLGCRTFPHELQSSAGLRMHLYPWSPDLVWPGHLQGTCCLSARALDTGFPTVVWCLCLGLGFAETPPFLAGVQGVCVLARVSASPRHSWLGFVVRAFGVWFRGNPATPGWGLGCVCLNMGFGWTLPFLAGTRGACEWVWVFRAPCYFWVGCPGACPLARAPSVSLRPLVGLPVAWVCMGVAAGGASPPPLFCFGLLGCGAGSVCVVLGPVVLWVCGGRHRLSQSWAPWLLPPLPLPFGSRLFFFSVWPVARILSGGVCPGVSGVSSPPALRRPSGYCGLLLLAGRRQAGRCGPPVFYRGASWVSLLVLPEGQFACFLWSGYADLRFCVCPPRFPSFPLTGGCAFLVGWVLPPSVFYFWGGGLPVPLSAFPGLVPALVSIRCG